jgi:uncharacterized protein YjbI with pentapeptide repeats
MAKKTIEAPLAPNSNDPSEPPDEALEGNVLYENFTLTGSDYAGQSVLKLRMEQARLQRVNFGSTRFTAIRLNDIRLTKCDLAAALWYQAQWRRVVVEDSRLLGWQGIEANLQDVHFKGCNMDSALFRVAKCQRVLFEDCTLKEADFYEADLTNVRFRNCDLRGASLAKATLKGTDLRTCQLEGITLSPEGVSGLIIEPSQAIDVIRVIGIQVEWEAGRG